MDGNGDALAALLDMARQVRHASDQAEVDFIAVNGTHALAPYRQAALLLPGRGICALSGVVQVEANAPYVDWLARTLPALTAGGAVGANEAGDEWREWLPEFGLWLPFAGGGLLLARDIPWMEREIVLLTEWSDILADRVRSNAKATHWRQALLARLKAAPGSRPWRRRLAAIAVVALVLLLPVRLTVLAPGELVPLNAAAIRAPLDGVIERFHVTPNQTVKKGDPLFDFDEGQLESRAAVAEQSLATAEAEYRQAAQQALSDPRSKSQLATLQGKIEERRAEAQFVRGQSERAHVQAPRDGIVLLDDPSEWVGRPVTTGERVMRVAAPREVEIEAWLAVGDAIPLVPGAPVALYLAASPLAPVDAVVRYVAYEAQARPDGSYAYRVRARLEAASAYRVGLKGTAKLSGDRVPLVYWVVRRPLAAIRQWLGW